MPSKPSVPSKPAKPEPPVETPFEFPQEAAQAINAASQLATGLPFDLCVWFAKNGSPKNKQAGGIPYTGGLATSSIPDNAFVVTDIYGEVHDVEETYGPKLVENINQNNGTFETVDLQAMIIAPILYRKRFHEGRSHAQLLCLHQVAPGVVGYALISARGYQSNHLLDAIGSVASLTANARRELGNPPAAFFWHYLGMPSQPEFKSVGKASTSIITPLVAKPLFDDLRKAYIGNELATILGTTAAMPEILAWRDAWKSEKRDEAQYTEDGWRRPQGYQPNPSVADDIPF